MTLSYDLVLFDADGTLWDYDAGERRALGEALEHAGLPSDQDVIRRYRAINAELWALIERGVVSTEFVRVERFRRFLAEIGSTVNAERVAVDYLNRLARQAIPMDGAADLLKTLSGHVRMAILTNGISEVQRSRFALSGYGAHIEQLIISEEVGVAKPDPAIFAFAMSAMGCQDRRRVLMVGDSLTSDIRGGAAADIATCWFNPSAAPNTSDTVPDYEIRRLSELCSIVGLSGH
ncbi:MAG: putative HAD-hydrolase YfnB [Firmicutes bacterium ADurb.Bin506]|nr:MAG: putative HAD-hydrolase YfnB [Firmicutes bacterium ADurb.Bin506]